MAKKNAIRKIKSPRLRGRVARSLAKTTKGGKGRIKQRQTYKKDFFG